MDQKETENTNKKPYLPPEVQAFHSLKEITLANTCGCDYWGTHLQSCSHCVNPSPSLPGIACPDGPVECF